MRFLSSDECPDWIKRYINETGANEYYGFARYIDPMAASKYDIQGYHLRAYVPITSGQVDRALKSQDLDWPASIAESETVKSQS